MHPVFSRVRAPRCAQANRLAHPKLHCALRRFKCNTSEFFVRRCHQIGHHNAVKSLMATKRIAKSESGAAPLGPSATSNKRSRSTAATHSKKPAVASLPVEQVHPVVETPISQDAVARLAYSYWEARGYSGGSPEQDWLRAEQELRSRL